MVAPLIAAGVAVSIASAMAAAYAQIAASRQASAVAKQNAQITQLNKLNMMREATAAEEKVRREGTLLGKTQRAIIGASGALGDTPLTIEEQTVFFTEMDARTIQVNAFNAGLGYDVAAESYLLRGEQAEKAGVFGAGTSLLAGGSQAIGVYQSGRIPLTPDEKAARQALKKSNKANKAARSGGVSV